MMETKSTAEQSPVTESTKDRVAKRMAAGIVRTQVFLCRWLSSLDQRLSNTSRKWLFLLFFLGGSTYCLWTLGDAVLRKHEFTAGVRQLMIQPKGSFPPPPIHRDSLKRKRP